jgi:hypothetical protein
MYNKTAAVRPICSSRLMPVHRFSDMVTARLAYDAAVRQLRGPAASTNYDTNTQQLRDTEALDKVQAFVLKMQGKQDSSSSRLAKHAVSSSKTGSSSSCAAAAHHAAAGDAVGDPATEQQQQPQQSHMTISTPSECPSMHASCLQEQQQYDLLFDLLMADDSSSSSRMQQPWGWPVTAATTPQQQQMEPLGDVMLQTLLQPEAMSPSHNTGHPCTADGAAGDSLNTAAVSSAAAATARPGDPNTGSSSRQQTGSSGVVEGRQPTKVQHLALPAAAGSCNITAGFAHAPVAAATANASAGGPGASDLLLTLQQPVTGTAAGGATAVLTSAMTSPEGIAVQSGMQGAWPWGDASAAEFTQQQQQHQQQQSLAFQLSDDDWDLLLPPLPAPLLQHQEQLQQAQQALLNASANVQAPTPSPAAAGAEIGSGVFGSNYPYPGGLVNFAGSSSCGDVLAFVHVSISHLMQLSAMLMSHNDSCCALLNLTAWLSQARKRQEAEAAAGNGSSATLQLLAQIMLLFSGKLAGMDGRDITYHPGVLAARPDVQALVDKLIAALANLGNKVFTAVSAAAASNVTQQMVGAWIMGLQQQAASGCAADMSVLQLCSALVQGWV